MKPIEWIRPTPIKGGAALGIGAVIILLDYVFGYCTEDMCFNGIYMIAGSMYQYFFLANVMRVILVALLAYAILSLIFLLYGIAKKR